jgi:hypothetical protein
MSLTKQEQDWLDEHPTRHSGGWIESFELAERRSRPVPKPAWRVAAEDRRAQLELMAYQMEREETL